MKNNKHKNQNAYKSYAKYSSIAVQMLVIILIGVFGGIKLDEWISWKFPVFTTILSIVSVFLAIYYVIRDLIKKDNS